MKRNEALTIVEMVVNSWPGKTSWTEAQIGSYADAIQDLDAESVTKGVARAVKEMRFPPSVAELREYARIERKVDERWREAPPVWHKTPAWALRWARARLAGDHRPFPEQALALRELGYDAPEAEHTDAEAWVQPAEYLTGDIKAPAKLVGLDSP